MTLERLVPHPLLVLLLAATVPGFAFAQRAGAVPTEREGMVVQVLEDRIIVDLGSAQGVLPGASVRILAADRDLALLGTSAVSEVAEAMCQVPLVGLDFDDVEVGDVVMIAIGPGEEPGGDAVDSAGAPVLARTAPDARVGGATVRRVRPRIAHEPLQGLIQGRSAMVTVVALGIDLDEATLFVRTTRKQSYRSISMARTGDAGWTATLDPSRVSAPRLEYYVAGRGADGREVPLFRTPGRPWSVEVRDPGDAGRRRARIGGTFEWQEFYMADPGRDAFWRTSVDFAYRLDKGALHELRGGVGALEGIGGDHWAVEDGDALDHRALAWMYFEPALRFGDWVRMYPRVMIGGFIRFVDQDWGDDFWDDVPERGSVLFGTSLHLEIGREHGFVFRTGGTILQGVGTELDAQATFQPVRGVPIGVAVTATNFPVGEEWGARVQLVAGYRALEWLAIDLKLGANVRTTRHAGVGGGLGLSFAW